MPAVETGIKEIGSFNDVKVMKKILMVLGAIFICLIVVGAIVFSGFYYYASGLDKEAKAYLDEVVPIIVTSWDPKELINRVSPEFLQVYPAEKVELLFNVLSKQIGPLKEYKGSTGKVKLTVTSKGELIIADYVAKAVFEKAPAKIQIQMIRRNNEWKIVGFRVSLEDFAPYEKSIPKRSYQF
ncbi:MAG: hypothetical protein HYW01_07420 [Deltaproteobacteria bacterium]|nr:hypothetical protein [Deltaproteobacteria bacterium]